MHIPKLFVTQLEKNCNKLERQIHSKFLPGRIINAFPNNISTNCKLGLQSNRTEVIPPLDVDKPNINAHATCSIIKHCTRFKANSLL